MEAVLRLPAVKARTGLARSTIYERIARNEFPAQVKLGARASGWLASEVDAWLAQRIAESRGEVES
jgi:prophage regulatory protein